MCGEGGDGHGDCGQEGDHHGGYEKYRNKAAAGKRKSVMAEEKKSAKVRREQVEHTDPPLKRDISSESYCFSKLCFQHAQSSLGTISQAFRTNNL